LTIFLGTLLSPKADYNLLHCISVNLVQGSLSSRWVHSQIYAVNHNPKGHRGVAGNLGCLR